MISPLHFHNYNYISNQSADDQKPQRKRKQSLKVAELLQDEANTPKASPSSTSYTPSDVDTPQFLASVSPASSPSSSGSWSSDSDDIAMPTGDVVAEKVKGEGEWPDASPNSSN